MIPIPLDDKEITFMACCGKVICSGCIHRGVLSSYLANGTPQHKIEKCSFCRQPTPKNEVKALKILMKRDVSQAFMQMSFRYTRGDGVIQSATKSLEMTTRAAELGFTEAFGKLGSYYEEGIAPIELDMPKALEFYQVAAKKGSVHAHQLLSVFQGNGINGNHQESIKHLKVAASAGGQAAMAMLMEFYKVKLISKEDLTKTLRAHQASLNEMKSKERDDAHAFRQLHEERLRNR